MLLINSSLSHFKTSLRFIKPLSLIVTLCLVLILDHDLNSKLDANKRSLFANGQLEAVGAVLSVVPVTSILATAGIVGVKLAALSRLLQVLGYDQAYLASGGSGTAAQPIGLQTNYAYMFPYVPGLNISVRGDSSGFGSQASSSTTRKNYPAMGIPGDYEQQQRPFRGSETLREIFRDSGYELRLPTTLQQQQSFSTQKGKHRQENLNHQTQPAHNMQHDFNTKSTTPIYQPNNLNSIAPTDVNSHRNENPNTHHNADPHPPPSHSASLMHAVPLAMNAADKPNSTPNQNRATNPNAGQTNQQQPQSSLANSPAPDRQGMPRVHPNNSPQPQDPSAVQAQPQNQFNRFQNSQVTMPHSRPQTPDFPHSAPVFSSHPPPAQPPPSSLAAGKPVQQEQSTTSHAPGLSSATRPHRPPSSPATADSRPAPLPSGQLVRVAPVPLSKPPSSFDDYARIIFGGQHGGGGTGNGASQAPAQQAGDRPPKATADTNNFGPSQNDVTTNIVSPPFATDGPPPFHDDMDQNEILNLRKRKKRQISTQLAAREAPQPSLGDLLKPGRMSSEQQQPVRKDANENFGMPALNIHPSFRRKKRSLRDLLLLV